jgi:hypothetical protein
MHGDRCWPHCDGRARNERGSNMHPNAAAQVLRFWQAVDDPKHTLAPGTSHAEIT